MRAAGPGPHLIHASCVAIDGHGILLLGPSGSGKSDLALRLIDRGAALVGDDQVRVEATEAGLIASPAPALAGLIEVRGIGILSVPRVRGRAIVDLAVELVPPAERLPAPRRHTLLGRDLPLFAIDPAAPSATARIRLLANGARPRETLARTGRE